MKINRELKIQLTNRVKNIPSTGNLYPTRDLHSDIIMILKILDRITEDVQWYSKKKVFQ